jgi:peptidoglycan/xylan/chitin deacetylase (PgdA/CDA1 family)
MTTTPIAPARQPGLKGIAKGAARSLGVRRGSVAAARMRLERNTLARFGRRTRLNGRILCYHSVGTPEWGVNDVAPARFAAQLEAALNAGYRFVSANEIAEGASSRRDLAITFDDGITSVATNAAPVLASLAIPWTLFVVTNWADGRHAMPDGLVLGWRAIERLAQQGAHIGSHSLTHPRFSSLSPEEARHEIAESKCVIKSRLGIEVDTFAIPFGQSNDWLPAHTELARAAGYRHIYAQSQMRRPQGTIGRTFITRFDSPRIFAAALRGRFDDWEEWV